MTIAEQNLAAYEEVSEEWNLSEQMRRFDRIVQVLREEHASAPWIEFGALSGGFAAMCADALGLSRSEIWCCDFAGSQVSRAAARGFSTAVWNLEGGPRPPSLRREMFQTILFCEIIEHLVAPDLILASVLELLAPGGLLVLTTPNLASLGNRIRLLRGQTPSLAAAPGSQFKASGSLAALDHLRVCVAEEWVALVESLGLRVDRVEGCTSAPRDPGRSFRRRVSVGLNTLLERIPLRLWQNTLIVARKPTS
jgi:SAM-dependent methyltransferase